MKILYFDCETTGLDPEKNDIIQMAGIVEIDGEVKEKFEFKCRPSDKGVIDIGALRINGFINKPIYSYEKPSSTLTKLFHIIDEYKSYLANSRFILAGKNIDFDIRFLRAMLLKNPIFNFYNFFKTYGYDLTTLAILFQKLGIIDFKGDFSLKNLAKHYEIKFKPHDAMEDIETTYQIFKLMEFQLDSICKIPKEVKGQWTP